MEPNHFEKLCLELLNAELALHIPVGPDLGPESDKGKIGCNKRDKGSRRSAQRISNRAHRRIVEGFGMPIGGDVDLGRKQAES
ncbi:MAG: hypothetical protein EOP06_11725 [Proteobacteria bacterium]|nr:MAG: hypothetical protein EOP06_11725 [Pseudomonadota bacterium]